MNAPRAPAAFSVDVEDWFHVENLKPAIVRDSWDRLELRVERNVDRMLGLMAQEDAHGTWFVLGWVAERLPSLVRRIAAAGHEIGSHGFGHERVDTLSPNQFRADVQRSKTVLEDILGAEVTGYRAPCFSITDWSIDVLREVGFRYDSSAFPVIAHDRYGRLQGVSAGSPILEIRPGFHEVCISSLPLCGWGLPWGGGGYFRLLPYRLFRAGVRRLLASGRPYVFYIHPWEFDPQQPRVAGLPRSHTFRHYLNLDRVEGRVAALLSDFHWTTIGSLLETAQQRLMDEKRGATAAIPPMASPVLIQRSNTSGQELEGRSRTPISNRCDTGDAQMETDSAQVAAGVPPGVARRLAAERKRILGKYGPSRGRHVLLVGGSGYIGGPLTTHLLCNGFRVTNLDLHVYRHGSAVSGYVAHPRYRLVNGDMGDAAALAVALEDVTDVVLLAGLVGDPITAKFPKESAAINELALRNCIDRLNGRGLERVVFISTCSNYGLVEGDELVTEESPLSPLSLYARSKVAIEDYILSLKGRIDYHPTILRFATAFGLAPRMRFDLTVNEFARELYLGRELVVYDEQSWRPYCHVKDFATLIARVLAFPAEDVSFEVFNAGSERNNHTKKQIVDIVRSRVADRTVLYSSNGADRRNYRVNFSKVLGRLYFEPAYSVADGVEEVVWALESGLLDDVEQLPNVYGNYSLPHFARLKD